MSTRTLALLLVTLTLCACATTATEDYVGESYPPVAEVDVYESASELTQSYRVMGVAMVNVPARGKLGESGAREQLIAQARAQGADAVFFGNPKKLLKESKRSAGYPSLDRNRYEVTYSASLLKYK